MSRSARPATQTAVPAWRRGRRRCLRGRSGTWRHRPALCMAHVTLGDIDLHFAWQAWRLWHWLALVARLVPVWRRGRRRCLRGRRGIWRHRPSLCVAGLALRDIGLHFAWQARHLWHWTGFGGAQKSSTQLCHRCMSHTTLSHGPFTHNFVTHNSFTHKSFTHNFVTYNSFTHNTFTHTNLHTRHCHTHSSFTQPVLHHLLSFLPFPSHFHTCLVIIGRN